MEASERYWADIYASYERLNLSRALKEAMKAKRYDEARARLVEWEAGISKSRVVPPGELFSYEIAMVLLDRATVCDREAN